MRKGFLQKDKQKSFFKIKAYEYLDFTLALNLQVNDINKAEVLKLWIESSDKIEIKNFFYNKTSNKDQEIDMNIINKISISSNSFLVNFLLLINKTDDMNKIFIEQDSFSQVQINKEESFILEILQLVSKNNFLFLNIPDSKSFDDSQIPNSILVLKINLNSNLIKEFTYGNKSLPSLSKSISYDDTYLKSIIKKDEILNEQTNMIIFNIDTILYRKDYNYLKDLVEIISSLKSIIIQIVVIFPNITKYISHIDYSTILTINEILYLSDIWIFDKNEAFIFFSLINNNSNIDDDTKDITIMSLKNQVLESLNIENLDKRKIEVRKLSENEYDNEGNIKIYKNMIIYDENISKIVNFSIGTNKKKKRIEIFIEKHNLFKIIYNKILNPSQSHIKSSIIKQNIICKYSSLLNPGLVGIFILNFYLNNNSFTESSISAGCFVNNIIKSIQEKNYTEISYMKEYSSSFNNKQLVFNQSKHNFLLDCVNQNKSRLNFYNPFNDKALNMFFSNKSVKKNLIKTGVAKIENDGRVTLSNFKFGNYIKNRKRQSLNESERANSNGKVLLLLPSLSIKKLKQCKNEIFPIKSYSVFDEYDK